MKILLLHWTGLHLGFLGCYGNDWVSTPAFDRLAAEGVVFDQHLADCLGQWPSAWTGVYRYPWLGEEHHALPAPPALPEILQAHGIAFTHITEAQLAGPAHVTAAGYLQETTSALRSALSDLSKQEQWLIWMELPSLLPPWLVDEQYLVHYFLPQTDLQESEIPEEEEDLDEEEDVEEEEEYPEEEEENGEEVVEEIDSENDEFEEEEFEENETDTGMIEEEVLLPVLDPPIGPVPADDADFLERLRLSYAAMVSQADDYLAAIRQILQEQNLGEEVLLIVTADRGLALGEHGIIGEAKPWLHEELIHLPLLLRLPRGEQAGRRIGGLTQPVDLFPTILEGFQIPPPEQHGKTLFPLIHSKVSRNRDYACAGWKLDLESEWVLRTEQWSLLVPREETSSRGVQLFARPEDRWEVNNVRQPHMDWVEKLELVLKEWIAATGKPGPLQPPQLPESNEMETAE